MYLACTRLWGRIAFPIGCLSVGFGVALGWLWDGLEWLCLGSRAPVFLRHELRAASKLHLLHKLYGFHWLHMFTGHDRRREGRGWRKRTTGYKCPCRNELRDGNTGVSTCFACLGARDPAKRVQAGSLGRESACTVLQAVVCLLLIASTAATAFCAKRRADLPSPATPIRHRAAGAESWVTSATSQSLMDTPKISVPAHLRPNTADRGVSVR